MKILIIDDERTIRKAIGFALRKQGHKIFEAENPSNGIGSMNIEDFNLIVIDLNMPFVSGIEFIRELKEKGKNIPTIILSSHHESLNGSLQSQIGPIKIISKDLPLQKILQYIENILKQIK